MKSPAEEWEQLIKDYHRDNATIARTKFKWLTPEGHPNAQPTPQEPVYEEGREEESDPS